MNAGELGRYLHTHIPLSAAMRVEVLEASRERVRLSAPLAPNINHRGTVFGGSAAALATLAAWALLHLRLSAEGFAGRIVIRRSHMDFEKPIAGAFEARAEAPDEPRWRRFRATLARGRPARIEMRAVLTFGGAKVGAFTGEFVALPGLGDDGG
ncbi:MAG TPA: YiiD C-terminal domain-containing protein [Steroidobacteraceae bacterium]